jgi:hypothetical protein
MPSQIGIGELLKAKSKAVETLRTVVAMLEQQSGHKLKQICTDIGKEWLNKVVDVFCKETVYYMRQQHPICLSKTVFLSVLSPPTLKW